MILAHCQLLSLVQSPEIPSEKGREYLLAFSQSAYLPKRTLNCLPLVHQRILVLMHGQSSPANTTSSPSYSASKMAFTAVGSSLRKVWNAVCLLGCLRSGRDDDDSLPWDNNPPPDLVTTAVLLGAAADPDQVESVELQPVQPVERSWERPRLPTAQPSTESDREGPWTEVPWQWI